MSEENTSEPKGPAWGYHKKTGDAKLFKDGEIPKEYSDAPPKVKDE